MSVIFWLLAALTIGGALATVLLRKLIHAALAATFAFGGLALLYLSLDAQFVGFAQILIYIGAVTILIVFAVLLTQSSALNQSKAKNDSVFSPGGIWGLVIAAGVFAVLAWSVIASQKATTAVSGASTSATPSASVMDIGQALVGNYVLPLEIVALVLTAALIGAVVIAMHEKGEAK
jgi:NADH:ubiquinone oxidoreductase subunit 6 (subunit J)